MTFMLRRWSEGHWPGFAGMQRDTDVMADLGGPIVEDANRQKFEWYRDAWAANGVSRWAVVDRLETFLGYTGVMLRNDPAHPLGSHYEIGWRFRRDAWGRGLATMSARQALDHAWSVLDASEILSYTAAVNLRSQNVMRRLGLRRDVTRDFNPKLDRTALIWVAGRPVMDVR